MDIKKALHFAYMIRGTHGHGKAAAVRKWRDVMKEHLQQKPANPKQMELFK